MELTSPSPIAAVRLRPVRLSRERARAYRELAAWWLGSRLLVLAAAAVVQVAGWPRAGWHPSLFRHPFVLLTWLDGRWYGIVAKRGYLLVQGRFSQTAFFPFFPVLERAGHLLGLPVDVAGVLIAHLGFLAGLLAAYELARAYLPEADARRSSIYLAIFPFGFVFSMAYPEGVVLPLVALAGVLVLRERWLAAGICAAAATLARPEGILLAVPIGACALRRWGRLDQWSRTRAVAAVLAAPAALGSFSAYLWWALGDPLAWTKAEQAWGRSFSATGVYRALVALAEAPAHHNTWLYRDAGFCALYLLLLGVALRARLPRSWVAAGLGMVLLPLASGSFTSDARFGLLALPVFWGLAVLGRRPRVHRAVLCAGPALLAAAMLMIPLRFP